MGLAELRRDLGMEAPQQDAPQPSRQGGLAGLRRDLGMEARPDISPTAPAPAPRSWFQRTVSDPATEFVGRELELLTTPFVGLARLAQGEPLSRAFGRETVESVGQGGEAARTRRQAAAPIVPQSGTEAGILAGTALAGPALAALGKAAPAIGTVLKGPGRMASVLPSAARITGATAGGALGGGVTGEGAGKGAAFGAAAGTAGETLAWAAGKFLRSVVGAGGRIAAQDAQRLGDAIGDLSDPLKGAKSAYDLQQLAAGTGERKLGAAKDVIVKTIERNTSPITVPALGPNPVTLSEANRVLSETGKRAFSGRGDAAAAQLYHQMDAEIRRGLDAVDPSGGALALFAQAQANYRKGLGLLGMLKPTGTYARSTGPVQLRPERIQQYVADPRTQEKLTERLTPAEFQRLVDVVTRGGGLGTQDVIHRTGMLERALGVGGLAGLLHPVTAPVAAVPAAQQLLLPNFWSRYAGRVPYAPPQAAKLGADVLAAKTLSLLEQAQQFRQVQR